MKRLLIFLSILAVVCDLKAQTFTNVPSVKQVVDDSIVSNRQLKAPIFNKLFNAVVQWLPDIISDTADVLYPYHGQIRFQESDQAAYIYDTIGYKRWVILNFVNTGYGITGDGTYLYPLQVDSTKFLLKNTAYPQSGSIFLNSRIRTEGYYSSGGGPLNEMISAVDLSVNPSGSTYWHNLIFGKAPNMASGNRVYMGVGRKDSSYGNFQMSYVYNGSNITKSWGAFGTYNVEGLVVVNLDGTVGIGYGRTGDFAAANYNNYFPHGSRYQLDVKKAGYFGDSLFVNNVPYPVTFDSTNYKQVVWDNGTKSFQKIYWAQSPGGTGGVTSVFGRTGAVTAQSGDYTFSQIGSKPTTLSGYGITDGVSTSRTITINGTSYDLSANRSWTVGDVTSTRSINTQYSITGGGNLSTNRTLQLVNDASSPGNWKGYVTNGSGVRGWSDVPYINDDSLYYSEAGTPKRVPNVDELLPATITSEVPGDVLGYTDGGWGNQKGAFVNNEITLLQSMGSPIKAFNYSPWQQTQGGSISSQTVYLEAIPVPTGTDSLTGVGFYLETSGSGYTASNFNGVALYTESGGTLTQVAISANDGSIFTGSAGYVMVPFTSKVKVSYGKVYAAILPSWSAASTSPKFSYQSVNMAGLGFTNNNKPSATLSGQSSMPSSINLSSTSTQTRHFIAFIY